MTNSTKSPNGDTDNEYSSDSKSQTSRPQNRKSKKIKQQRGRKPAPSYYKYNSHITESPGTQIFAVSFNYFVKDREIFASAAGNKISIYECLDDEEQSMKLLRVYSEPDKDEVFNALSWSYDSTGPILAAAGVKGVIRVIQCNVQPMSCYKNLIGHTGAVNDLKFHPIHQHLLLTCSKDYSIRFWNVRNSTCVAIFAGIRGHRDEVLTIDISSDGKKFISGGIDHNVMVWDLDAEEINEKIAKSNEIESFGRGSFTAVRLHFPDFATRQIHGNYVDSVKFFGDTYLTKSCENNIIWWNNINDATISKLFTFDLIESDIWYMKMDLDLAKKFLAVGSQTGKVFVFNLDTDAPVNRRCTLVHPKCTSPVRQTTFSKNGEILIAACDDGSIWRWDKKKQQ